MTAATNRGMRTFFVVWVGQFVSLIGTNLTGFALALFVYTETGSATQLSMVFLASRLPEIIFTPFAGALVDRWDRRVAMMVSDGGAGVATLVIALLVGTGRLEIWHLYPLLALQGLFQTFQFPAYSAATSLLVRKEHYGRAAGLVQLAEAGGQVIAPALAAVLLVAGGLELVIGVDVVTFLFAISTLAFVRFPAPEVSAESAEAAGSITGEVAFGIRYLRRRPGLLALLAYFAVLNLVFGYIGVLIFPLVLGFASEQATGSVVSIGAVGMIVGSLLMSVWGGPKRRVMGVIVGDVILSLALLVMGLRPSLFLVTAAAVFGFFAIPLANSASQAIWQSKVAPDVQGRVFAVRRALAGIMAPLALISAGPLLDGLFQPWMDEGGALAGSVGAVIGTGPGRGAGLFLVVLGAVGILVSFVAYSYPRLRNLETEIPDAVPDTPPAVPEATGPEPDPAGDGRLGDGLAPEAVPGEA